MRKLAAQLNAYLRRSAASNAQSLNFSHNSSKGGGVGGGRGDEFSMEEAEAEAEKKIGWVLKLIFAGTATAVAYQFFPYMGDNLIQQSVLLLKVKDPLFKRMGASRLTRFAIDDERRMKIVEVGGIQHLVTMLESAKDDHTRKAALKALAALSPSDLAVRALHQAGGFSVIKSTPESLEEAEIEKYKTTLLQRIQDSRHGDLPSGID